MVVALDTLFILHLVYQKLLAIFLFPVAMHLLAKLADVLMSE